LDLRSGKLRIYIVAGLVVVGALAMTIPNASSLVRPKAATPMSTPLVIAYNECTTAGGSPPGQEHNPANLTGDACAPEVRTSPRLTAGEPPVSAANFRGNLKQVVCITAATCTAGGGSGSVDVLFPSGIPANNSVEDVRCQLPPDGGAAGFAAPGVCASANAAGTAPDYGTTIGPAPAFLLGIAKIRITDINTGPAGGPYTTEGTTEDLDFGIPILCVPTGSTTTGGTCSPAAASANAVCSGCVGVGKRANIEVGTVNGLLRVQEPGPDSSPATFGDNVDYARPGLFLP
jgi:hypothetical protein